MPVILSTAAKDLGFIAHKEILRCAQNDSNFSMNNPG